MSNIIPVEEWPQHWLDWQPTEKQKAEFLGLLADVKRKEFDEQRSMEQTGGGTGTPPTDTTRQ